MPELIRIPRLGRRIKPWSDVYCIRALQRIMREFQPHVVHTHAAKAGLVGRVAATLNHVPILVHTFHGHLLYGYFSRPVTNLVVRAERYLARRTTRLVAVGERVKRELIDSGVGRTDQYVVVPPGIEPLEPVSREVARQRLGLRPSVGVVAFVGRLTRVKRPDRFLRLAMALAQRLPDVIFLVAGEGELSHDIRSQAERSLGHRVMFLGWRRDMENVFGAADVIVSTSDNEGAPVALMEAAWHSRVCVATDVGSTGEVVLNGRTGFLRTSMILLTLARGSYLMISSAHRWELRLAS
jgi:glycosyltransferase involved in cell wall biosynthesis